MDRQRGGQRSRQTEEQADRGAYRQKEEWTDTGADRRRAGGHVQRCEMREAGPVMHLSTNSIDRPFTGSWRLLTVSDFPRPTLGVTFLPHLTPHPANREAGEKF